MLNIIITIWGIIILNYFMIILGMLGLISGILSKDETKPIIDNPKRDSYLISYIILFVILAIHTFLIFK